MMNFSNNMTPPHKRRATYWVDLVVGLVVGAVLALVFALAAWKITTNANAVETPVVGPTEPVFSVPPVTIPNDPTPPLPPFPLWPRKTCPLGLAGSPPIVRVKSAVVNGQRTALMVWCMGPLVSRWKPVCLALPLGPLERLWKLKDWVNTSFMIAPPNG